MNNNLESINNEDNQEDLYYNWKRFLRPRDGRKPNFNDGGFLFDPDSKLPSARKRELVSLDQLVEIPCIVVLGEPGIGKTTVIEEEAKRMGEKNNNGKYDVLSFDLGSYSNETNMIENVFKDDKFLSWINSENVLYLFLDSLEECKFNINNLSKLLILKLEKYPIDRLFIRITCRTADWPISFEKDLNRIWDENGAHNVNIYELVPLRRMDVKNAVECNNINFEDFLIELNRLNAVSWAIKPNTLKFLINTYKKTGNFSDTMEELYLKGCEILCEENNERKSDMGYLGYLSSKERLIIASRIAVAIIFGNKRAIYVGSDLGDVPVVDIKINDLAFSYEMVDGNKLPVDNKAIKDTLRSGLFSSIGKNRFDFSQKTYAEFLAAYYLKEKMDLNQIRNLLIHPYIDDKIISEFKETAAWLASMRPDFFREIININPEILLLSDLKRVKDKDKSKLVNTLLNFFNDEKLVYDYAITSNYHKLDHPGINKQLMHYLNRSYKNIARENAIKIAEECNLGKKDEKLELKANESELQKLIVDIALDKNEDIHLRITAADAISEIGKDEARERIKPLTKGVEDDFDDELKGYSLRAVWPKKMSAAELFSVLHHPKNSNLIGGYGSFISMDLVPFIELNDLQLALKWIKGLYDGKNVYYLFDDLADKILIKALDNLDYNGILDEFVDVCIMWINRRNSYPDDKFEPKLKEFVEKEDEKRHKIFELITLKIYDPNDVRRHAGFEPLTLKKDIPWMLNKFLDIKEDKIKLIWIEFISWHFAPYIREHRKALKDTISNLNEIPDEFNKLNKKIEFFYFKKINNNLKNRTRNFKHNDYRSLKRSLRKKRNNFYNKRSIKKLLGEFEAGNLNKWIEIDIKLNKIYEFEYKADSKKSYSWENLDDKTRARLIDAGKKYVKNGNPENDVWLGKGNFTYSALAGYKALHTIYNEKHGYIDNFPSQIWEKWASIILSYPNKSPSDDENIQKKLVKLVFDNAPDQFMETLKILFVKECDSGYPFIIRKIEDCWDNNLEMALLDIIRLKNSSQDCVETVLGFLIGKKSNDSLILAESFVQNHDSNFEDKAIAAAVALFFNAADAGWSSIWPVIENNPEFGKKVMNKFVNRISRHEKIFEKLSEGQLAELYIWLEHNFPYLDDVNFDNEYRTTSRDEMKYLKSFCINYLEQKGNDAAYEAIEHIIMEFPNEEWLKQVLLRAKVITRNKKWIPFNPTDIIKISRNNKYHLVESGNQLQEVVLESLKRLDKKLHGENLPLKFLWNEYKGKFRPKKENSFSDYVKIYLEDDIQNRGIILNREVEVRGKFADIHIDATSNDDTEGYKVLKVIIESKGCWNPGINDSMESQLLNKYLKGSDCQNGIYLVGWFNCDKWDDEDPKKKNARRLVGENKDIYLNVLKTRASKLSKDGICLKSFILDASIKDTYTI